MTDRTVLMWIWGACLVVALGVGAYGMGNYDGYVEGLDVGVATCIKYGG